jgi:hypothetical protein
VGKQYLISPSLFTATRKRIASGVSLFEAMNFGAGNVVLPKASSSLENETDVAIGPLAKELFWRGNGTASGGWESGARESTLKAGGSLRLGSITL